MVDCDPQPLTPEQIVPGLRCLLVVPDGVFAVEVLSTNGSVDAFRFTATVQEPLFGYRFTVTADELFAPGAND